MPSKIKWPLFAILSLFLISGCAPDVPDVAVFENMSQRLTTDPQTGHLLLVPSPTCMEKIGEPECGHAKYTMSNKELFIGEAEANRFNGKPWSVIKQQSLYLPARESGAPLFKYMIDACIKMGCNDAVTKFKVKLNSFNGLSALFGS